MRRVQPLADDLYVYCSSMGQAILALILAVAIWVFIPLADSMGWPRVSK